MTSGHLSNFIESEKDRENDNCFHDLRPSYQFHGESESWSKKGQSVEHCVLTLCTAIDKCNTIKMIKKEELSIGHIMRSGMTIFSDLLISQVESSSFVILNSVPLFSSCK